MTDYLSSSLSAIAVQEPELLEAARAKLASSAVAMTIGGGFHLERMGASSGVNFEPLRRAEALDPKSMRVRMVTEAMIERQIRPPMLIKDGTYVLPDKRTTLPAVLNIIGAIDRHKIDPAIAVTGRVEFVNVPGRIYTGTGWIIRKPSDTQAVVVTNRHVAETFARADQRGGYPFLLLPNFSEYEMRIDLIAEDGATKTRRAPIPKVLFMAGSRAPDIALLMVEGDEVCGLSPVDLSDTYPRPGDDIGVVGYPANDSNSYAVDLQGDLTAYFNDLYNVKYFSFGKVTGVSETALEFSHDATTMPGNSGSVVIDRSTGKVAGLHFAGQLLATNYAVSARELKSVLAGLEPTSVVSRAVTEATGDGFSPVASFAGRKGYNRRFLSRKAIEPPRPGIIWKDDLASVIDADGGGQVKELKYRHFSVWMSQSRKLPLITAVNIDGARSKRLGRIDTWYLDGRLDAKFQVDNDGYKGNPLDRGHMVRREDPVWGDLRTAREANRDTFHYTNAAPQHEALNQRDWLRLEEYVLGNARTEKLKVSVFTGPIFADKDPLYRGLVRMPMAFWKIVAIINGQTRKPSVTGYLLSQGDLIRDVVGEFVYGPFRTYQTEVLAIGQLARLDVYHLARHDPLAATRRAEGLEGDFGRFHVISSSEDLVL